MYFQKGGESKETIASNLLQDILDRYKEISFDIESIYSKCKNQLNPFQIVLVQECYSMNLLIKKIILSLNELDLALKGLYS